MSKKRTEFENTINPKLNDHLKGLERLRDRQHQQLELKFSDLTETAVATKQGATVNSAASISFLTTIYNGWKIP